MEGIENLDVVDAEFDDFGVGGERVGFVDHVVGVGSGALADAVEELLATFDNLFGSLEIRALGGRGDLVDPHGGVTDRIDDDLGDDEVSVEEVFVLADRDDLAERDQVAAAG